MVYIKEANKLPSLNKLLKYKNLKVIKRYMQEYQSTRYFAERMFEEMLKFLWLSQKNAKEGSKVRVGYLVDMKCIDWMWHEFILFTRDYADFCFKYFGGFIHHDINYKEDETSDEDIDRYIQYIYVNLGPETLKYWFKPAHKRMVDDYMRKRETISINKTKSLQ